MVRAGLTRDRQIASTACWPLSHAASTHTCNFHHNHKFLPPQLSSDKPHPIHPPQPTPPPKKKEEEEEERSYAVFLPKTWCLQFTIVQIVGFLIHLWSWLKNKVENSDLYMNSNHILTSFQGLNRTVVYIRASSWQSSPASLPGFAGYFHCFMSQDMLRRWCLSGPTTVYFSQNSSYFKT